MWFAFVALMAFLNRFRGGGFGASCLPGHPRFYVAPVVGAVTGVATLDWLHGLICGACYLAWSFLPWGHLMCLGHYAPPRPVSWLESDCLKAAHGNRYLALWGLHTVGMAPAMFLISPAAIFAPPLYVLAYVIGWTLTPKAPIRTAELLVGAVWGAVLLGVP